MRPPEKGNLKTGFKKGDFLFPARICGWKSWGQVYQSIDAFRPIIREIFRRHSLAYEEPKQLTPGTNAVIRVGKQIVTIYAPAKSVFVHGDLTGENVLLLPKREGTTAAGRLFVLDFGDCQLAPFYYEWPPLVWELFRWDSVMLKS